MNKLFLKIKEKNTTLKRNRMTIKTISRVVTKKISFYTIFGGITTFIFNEEL